MSGPGVVIAVVLGATVIVMLVILAVIPFLIESLHGRTCMRDRVSSLPTPNDQAATSAAVKPRVRIRPDGWVRHGGGSFPFASNTVVETGHAGGFYALGKQAEYALFWPDEWWRGNAICWQNNILFYRIIRLPIAVSLPESR